MASTDNSLTKRGDSSGQETDITAEQRGRGKDLQMSRLRESIHVQRFSYVLLSMLCHGVYERVDVHRHTLFAIFLRVAFLLLASDKQ